MTGTSTSFVRSAGGLSAFPSEHNPTLKYPPAIKWIRSKFPFQGFAKTV